MAILTAAVILVGVLVLLDLLLTLGLIKRVRTHAELLDKLVNATPASVHAVEPGQLPPGKPIGEFTATTSDGLEISRESFDGGLVLGFFSTWCDTCAEQLPGFLAYAEPLGRERVLAVVHGEEDHWSTWSRPCRRWRRSWSRPRTDRSPRRWVFGPSRRWRLSTRTGG